MPANIIPVPKPVLIIDTSGSMNDKDLGLALGVVADVVRCLPSNEGVRVITGDTRAAACKKAFRAENVELVGGGGTDMGRIMVDAVKKYPDADVIVVITDGYTPWPHNPLPQRCLALLTQESQMGSVPKWMRSVYIAND